MKLGIIGAMEVEIATLVERLAEKSSATWAGSTYYTGRLEGLDVVVVQCGVGKVNAAMCAQILCDRYEVTHLVNTGVAGSLDANLDIGDLLISKDAIHHDMNCNYLNYPTGQVPGLPVLTFEADKRLIDCAFRVAEEVNPGHTKIGRVASGDQFISNKAQKEKIIADTGASCAEMEGSAIAHTAYRNGIPFVIIRAISDKADDSAQMDYPSFEAIAAKRCAEVTARLAKFLAK